jgi:hypothetical protein
VLATSTRALLSFAAAAAVHAPVLLITPAPRGAPAQAAMTFEVNVAVAVVSSVQLAPAAPLPSPAPATHLVSRRTTPRAAEGAPAAHVAPLPGPALDEARVVEDAEPVPASVQVQRDLSPLAAARSVSLGVPDGSARATPSAAASDTREEARLADGIGGLTRDSRPLKRSVGELALDAQTAALRPWDLLIQPLPRGRYRYRGVGFDAVITADGSIKYRDKDGVHLSAGQVLALKEPTGSKSGRSLLNGAFGLSLGDPRTWGAKLTGKDPHAAERRTFVERTRALREYLRARAERPRGAPAPPAEAMPPCPDGVEGADCE